MIGCELDEAVWLLTTRLGGGVRGLIHVTVVIQISSDASLIALAGCSRWLLLLVCLLVLAGCLRCSGCAGIGDYVGARDIVHTIVYWFESDRSITIS